MRIGTMEEHSYLGSHQLKFRVYDQDPTNDESAYLDPPSTHLNVSKDRFLLWDLWVLGGSRYIRFESQAIRHSQVSGARVVQSQMTQGWQRVPNSAGAWILPPIRNQ